MSKRQGHVTSAFLEINMRHQDPPPPPPHQGPHNKLVPNTRLHNYNRFLVALFLLDDRSVGGVIGPGTGVGKVGTLGLGPRVVWLCGDIDISEIRHATCSFSDTTGGGGDLS